MYKIHVVNHLKRQTYERRSSDNVISIESRKCDSLLLSILLVISSRVMLRCTITVLDGFLNGKILVVKWCKWSALCKDQLQEEELPDAIFIKFDDGSISNSLNDANDYVSNFPMTIW